MYTFKDIRPTPDKVQEYTDNLKTQVIPIVIDNGSCNCRVGWAVDSQPRLVFKNILAKQRGKKDHEVLVGNEIPNIEVVRWLVKSPFERNIITQFDTQEHILDHVFSYMGIDTNGSVEHPIVMTEAFCNPNYSRQLMSELLFECYSVPKVSYGVDGLFSFHKNLTVPFQSQYGLIVSVGFQTTHIIPVVKGRADFTNSRRINVGGFHISSFIHRLLQLKYAAHVNAITLSRAEELINEHAYIAREYKAELRNWEELDYYEGNTFKYQLPFTAAPVVTEIQIEKRKENVKRLKEMNAKRRDERLVLDEQKLQEFQSLLEFLEDDEYNDTSHQKELDRTGFESVGELRDAIEKLGGQIGRAKQKQMQPPPNEEIGPQEPKPKKFCAEYERLKERGGDVISYLEKIKRDREAIIDKRTNRKQRKSDMSKRGTLAAQERMRIMWKLAAEKKKDDTFGMNEDDWLLYKQINKEADDTDSEEELEKLNEFENILRHHDPQFQKDLDAQASDSTCSLAEMYQIHVGLERCRAPEVLFQPAMIGVEQGGISELIHWVLSLYDSETQNLMVQNVLVTGSCAAIPGFKERLETDLLSVRPFQSTFNVKLADNPSLDSWIGAQLATLSNDVVYISRQDYEEKGGDYLKEHVSSNVFNQFVAPAPLSAADLIMNFGQTA